MNRRKFVTAFFSLPVLAIPAAAIAASSKSSSIVTELVIDARGVAAGSEAYIRAMEARAAHYERRLKAGFLTADEARLLETRRYSIEHIAKSWNKLRASVGMGPV